MRNTAVRSPVRQIEVISRSPGKTGAVNRADIAEIFEASPSQRPATSARPAMPYVHSPCMIGRGNPAFSRAYHGSLCRGLRSPVSR